MFLTSVNLTFSILCLEIQFSENGVRRFHHTLRGAQKKLRNLVLYKERKCMYIYFLSSLCNFENSAPRNIPEERRSELHLGGNLKSCTDFIRMSLVVLHSAMPNQGQS